MPNRFRLWFAAPERNPNERDLRWSFACGVDDDEPAVTGRSPRTPSFSAYFSPALAGNNLTFKKVIDPSNGYDPVARNCLAALLNASTAPPLTPASILGVAKAKAIWSSYATKGYFEPTAGIQWNGAKIVDWITTTYS